MKPLRLAPLAASLVLTVAILPTGLVRDLAAQSREEKVLEDHRRVTADGFWLYQDLESGLREARRSGKPLLVTLRCIPCEECVKLDEELMESDPELRQLLEQFVRVRLVSTNGLDLDLFQFDTDQSFAIFLMNADRTIYGRYGTRSARTEWIDDVSIAGLTRALERALELHEDPSEFRAGLRDKTGPPAEFDRPEKLPSLATRYASRLNFTPGVVQNCIHCHQIGDALRDHLRSRGEPFPETVLFPYPHPKIVGLIVDPATCGTLKEVVAGSAAERAGFEAGDEIIAFGGQPILSIADLQWVLHQAGSYVSITAEIERDGVRHSLTLDLDEGWKRQGDLSWRVSSWNLRKMTTGGLVLETADPARRRAARIDPDATALVVAYVGQYGEHAAGKEAGFLKDDLIVAFDGRKDLRSESELFAYALEERRPGERVSVTVLRDGREIELMLPMQR